MKATYKTLKLNHGTIFLDMNKSKGLEPSHITTELELNLLQYKHLKEMQSIKIEEHMNYAIRQLTDLSEKDLDELSVEDTAELIKIVYEIMSKHIEIAKTLFQSNNDFNQAILSTINYKKS